MSRKIFVFSIPRESALGISKWTNDVGTKLNRTKVGKTTDKIVALRDPRVGGLANYISYNPWIDKETGLVKKDVNGKELTLQDYMEEKWKLPKGYLTNREWRNGDSLDPEKMTYYQRKAWVIKDGSTCFDLDDMDQELGYYVLLASQYIANSEKEWRAHKWPQAKWYIALDNETETIKNQRNEYKGKAIAKLYDPSMTDSYKKKFAVILQLVSARHTVTKEQVDNLLFEYIDNSATIPPSNIDKFNSLFSLLSTPNGREEVEARYLLQSAIDTKIVYEKQGTYTFIRPEGVLVIGERIEDTIEFLMSPKKDKEISLMKELVANKLK